MDDLPLISEPPYWRPVAPQEIALLAGCENPPPEALEALELGAPWTLAFFSYGADAQRRSPFWGWAAGDLAICEGPYYGDGDRELFYCARLLYLPRCYRIAMFDTADDAALGGRVLAREIDWVDTSFDAFARQAPRALERIEAHFDMRPDRLPLKIWRARFDAAIVRAHG